MTGADGTSSLAMRARATVGKASLNSRGKPEPVASSKVEPVKFEATKKPLHRIGHEQRKPTLPVNRAGSRTGTAPEAPEHFLTSVGSVPSFVPSIQNFQVLRQTSTVTSRHPSDFDEVSTLRSTGSSPQQTPRTLTDNALAKSQQLLQEMQQLELWDDVHHEESPYQSPGMEPDSPCSPCSNCSVQPANWAMPSDLLHSESPGDMVSVPTEMVNMLSELWEELRDMHASQTLKTPTHPAKPQGHSASVTSHDFRDTSSLRYRGPESPLSATRSSACDSTGSTRLPSWPSPGASDSSQLHGVSSHGSVQYSPSADLRRQLLTESCACDVQLRLPGVHMLQRSSSMSSIAQSCLGVKSGYVRQRVADIEAGKPCSSAARSLASQSHTALPNRYSLPQPPQGVRSAPARASLPHPEGSAARTSSPPVAARYIGQTVEVKNVYELVPVAL